MTFENRIQQMPFLENQQEIESDWDINFGDRKNEIVFIGQNMNEILIKSLMDRCLSTDNELKTGQWEKGYKDDWPVERAYPI